MRWCRYTALAACVLALTSCSGDTDKLAKEGPELSLLARAFTAFGPPGQSTREATPTIDTRQMELEAAERQKVRGEISTMVSEKPDEVAAMLRGWLSENKA